MWHGAGHGKAVGNRGSCDRYVGFDAESPRDSARPFEFAYISAGYLLAEEKWTIVQ